MKLQIDRMIAKFFSSLPVDEQLNFSVAVTVMSVQRKWRQRMKAHKACLHPHKAAEIYKQNLHHTAVVSQTCTPAVWNGQAHRMQLANFTTLRNQNKDLAELHGRQSILCKPLVESKQHRAKQQHLLLSYHHLRQTRPPEASCSSVQIVDSRSTPESLVIDQHLKRNVLLYFGCPINSYLRTLPQ